jgi:hypothetical protein
MSEDGRKSGDNCFFGWECKEPSILGKVINYTKHVFDSLRPCLLEWDEDARVQCTETSCRLSAGLGDYKGMVQFG